MPPPLPSNIKRLGWISLLNDISSEMIFPLLPVFLTTVLGAGTLALGAIEGVSDSLSSLLKFFAGQWSDKLKKKKVFVVIGYSLSTIFRPLIALAPHWSFVFGFRLGDRVGKGIRTAPRDALIAASISNNQAGYAFGFHRMMDHVGAVVGSFLGAFLIYLAPNQYRLIFLSALIPGILGLVLLRGVKEASGLSPHSSFSSPPETSSPLPPRVKGFLILLFFFTLGNATDAFLLLRLKEGGIPVVFLPLLWGGLHIVKALTNPLFGKISDKIDRRRLLLLGWLFYGTVYLLFALPLSQTISAILFLAYGIFYGLTEGPERALLYDWVSPLQHGKVYGLYHMVLGITLLPASLLFGFLWEIGGYPVPFAVGAALSFITSLVLSLWLKKVRLKPPQYRPGPSHSS